MNFIAVDLKVIEVSAPGVARALGVDVATVIGSLSLLWHRCWSMKSDKVSALELRGYFPQGDAGDLLAAFGLLETDPAGWRVKGAERYLRITEQRQKAGRARAASAGRSAGVFTSGAPAADQRSTSGGPALSPSTEHRAPNTEKKEEDPPPPVPPVAAFELARPDIAAIDSWSKEDFWRAAEITRREAGFPPERWPNPVALSRWWSESRQVADTTALAEAFVRFTREQHWRAATPPCPWAAFAKQYLNFLPPRT